MSGVHDSWEDDPAAQDDNLSRQTQTLNLNTAAAPTFRPGAASFTPSAPSFQPGQPYAPYAYPYGQYAGAGYGPYAQYAQIYGQQFGGYGGYGYPNYGQSQQPQWQPQAASPAATAPSATAPSATAPAAASPKPASPQQSEVKPKPAQTPKTKVLSIGSELKAKPAENKSAGSSKGSAPAQEIENSTGPAATEAASKVTASKAVDKTPSKKASSSGKTSPALSSGRSSPSSKRAADSVAREQQADVDEATLKEIYGEKREHVNLIFIGHVDAGKSTLGGSILYCTGMVDERTMEKYKKEAKEAGRETWWLSWALDLTNEERSKGKTVEVGRGYFRTTGDTPDGPVERTYTILDAPGHKSYVPNMIGGAAQADVGILVISARKGEYETGFEKGGQTREHALLARNSGVRRLIIAVNKMDDMTVQWEKSRFEECTVKIAKFLEAMGYKKNDLYFTPISAQRTLGIATAVPSDVCPWFKGPGLLEYLHTMTMPERKINAPFMMPISAKYREMGTMIEGRVESGVIKKGNTYLMMPSKQEVMIYTLYGETEDEIATATSGDQIRARLRGAEEDEILPGYVLCSPKRPVHCVKAFEAKIRILELKSIMTAGFNCVLHVHSAIEEVTVAALLHKLEKGTDRKSKRPPPFVSKGQTVIARLEMIGTAGTVCVERYEDYQQLGRFTLRDQVGGDGSFAA